VSRPAKAYLALFLANAVAVVLIWVAALEANSFSSLAGGLNAAGRITGLLGTYLVLVQLILRTHVPWLVAAFGKDALKTWHTWNAYVAFALIGAHVALQVVGYALQDRVDLVNELGLLIGHYEGMILAIAGFGLLAALTLIAVDPIRHRVPWPTWRALHLYTYVAIALSVPHMIATGSDFIDAPVAVVYWTGLLGAVVAILVAARVPPLWRAATANGRPHPAIVAIGALVIAAYLVGTVRLSPSTEVTLAVAQPNAHFPPLRESSASGGVVRPSPTPSVRVADSVIAGEPIDTPYGTAQVRLILSSGRIADVEPILMPSATRRSKTISASIEPWLRKRAIAAQSADFEILSGATYTSRAYQASLESALRAAGLD
jgi:uncharacterized protein with FMN-binding domain/DMSO/TMAO reductase YedYZ heme-binding membrane subunit